MLVKDADYRALFRAVGFCKDVWWKRASSEAKESVHALPTEDMGKQVGDGNGEARCLLIAVVMMVELEGGHLVKTALTKRVACITPSFTRCQAHS